MPESRSETGDRLSQRKPVGWLNGEFKTPPFTDKARREAGELLRLLQEGKTLEMPAYETIPEIGPRCGALRVQDEDHYWRIVCRTDHDAVLVVEVYPKKTRKLPQALIDRCKGRLKRYDEVAKEAARKAARTEFQ